MPTAATGLTKAYVAPLEEVQLFLTELKCVLTSDRFNINTDLDILGKKSSEDPRDPFTTSNTMLSLDFDANDIKDQLLALDASEYFETVPDNKNPAFPSFYAFIKLIQSQKVYIKVKIRDRDNNKVFCVSFHFARYPISTLPYVK